ncbi:MAG: hypothetical protein QXU18_12760 [Thermoplasmatales archaeon]
MSEIPAHCPEDKKIIDELIKRINDQEKLIEQQKRSIDEIKKGYEKLRKEFDDYKVRHPENTGIKNGKPYFIMPEKRNENTETKVSDLNETHIVVKKRPGARIGHKGYHRPLPDHVDFEKTVSIEQCPDC